MQCAAGDRSRAVGTIAHQIDAFPGISDIAVTGSI
jgi:hypothetical protein